MFSISWASRFLTLRQKLTGLLLAALLLGLVAACGGSDDGGSDAAEDDTLKVGLLTDQGQLNDRGFNELAFRGLKEAERELGVEGRVIQAASASDYIPNMTALIRDDFDLIIGVGFAHGDAVTKVAKRFPDRKFVIIDVDQSSLEGKPENVVGLLFREEQVGYLAGYAAALAEKRRAGKDVIGSVAGMKEPPVDRFIAGYQAGAKAADPGIDVLNDYSQDWEDVAKCKELALNQIARGAGVVFQVAGGCGLGALEAAKEKNAWGIGVDADQFFLGQHILTSAMKRVDEAVFSTIESVQDGSWQGGRNLTFGLAEDGVALGTFSPKVPEEDKEAVEAVAKKIAAGDIQIPTTF
jgi:basic membrane protein A and related proteins